MELPGKMALITGVSGFVGSRTARRLVQEGMHVRGLVRRPVDLPDRMQHSGEFCSQRSVTHDGPTEHPPDHLRPAAR